MKRIPLYRRDGCVTAHALVDDGDYEWIAAHRWFRNDQGYAVRSLPAAERTAGRGFTVRMAREIVGLAAGDPRHVDHRNRDRLDNRRANLRVVSLAANRQNIGSRRGAKSRYRGVAPLHGSWRATAQRDGRAHHIGVFGTEIGAALAADAFRRRHMPHAEPEPIFGPIALATVCVLSYERLDALRTCLSSLVDSGFPIEVLVRDDGSRDPDVRRWLIEELEGGRLSSVAFAPPGHNEGVGASFNRMAAVASGQLIVKSDQDLVFSPSWLAEIVGILERNAVRQEPMIGSMGLFRYERDPVDHRLMLIADHGEWQEVEDYVGSAVVIRREVWDAFGPWEEHSEAFAEDVAFKRALASFGLVHALPRQDLCANRGFGIGPSTVVVAEGQVREIHKGPVVLS